MNKKVLIAVTILLLLVAGGFFAFKSFKSNPRETENVQNTSENTDQGSPKNLKEIFTKNTTQTCTYNSDKGTGSVYVSGGKVRGDFDVETSGQTVKSHMIVKDGTSYMWSDGQNMGIKMSFDPNTISASTNPGTESVTGSGPNFNTEYDYKCSTWVADEAQFNLPAGVTFSSFTLPTSSSSAPTGQGSAPASQCSYCATLSGDDKTQCLKALNCQ